MSLMCSFWQMADMHVCFMRVPTLLKVWQLPSARWSPRVGAAAGRLCKRCTVLPWQFGTHVRALASLQAKAQSVAAEDFQLAVQSGTRFVDMMKKVESVAEYAVPPGAPSMTDTTLTGITELGRLSRSCAPQWWVQAGLYFQVACAEPCSNLTLTQKMLLRLMLSVSAVQATGVHGSEAPDFAAECSGVCNGFGLQN